MFLSVGILHCCEQEGDGAEQFAVAPQASISGPADGPAFCVGCSRNAAGFAAAGVSFADLMIEASGVAVVIRNSNCVRMRNVAAQALNDVDGVNTTKSGCNGCNVKLGSWNAAVVVENSLCAHFVVPQTCNLQQFRLAVVSFGCTSFAHAATNWALLSLQLDMVRGLRLSLSACV